MNVVAKKKLGQNFLVDNFVVDGIISELDLTQPIIEIGPGTGALTSRLADAPRLDLVELDGDLIENLQVSFKKATIHNADAMKFDFSTIITPTTMIVGNLPYNVGTQIIIRLLEMGLQNKMIFMLQKEVADRFVAQFGEDGYGKLGLYTSVFASAEKLFEVPPTSFVPMPKVFSAVIKLEPHTTNIDRVRFQQILAHSFKHPRKQVGNNLKGIFSREQLEKLGISPTKRPDELTRLDYINLANNL